jgi:DNA polymerase-4
VRHRTLAALTMAHIDCDAFYATVEKRDAPELADQPLIIGGGKRGVVAAACYIARTYGVRSAMPMYKALEACPHAAVVRPDMAKYVRVGREVRRAMEALTPLVEPLSIDEAFLDVRGLRRVSGQPSDIASRLRQAVREQVGLAITVGVARTKFLAKVASGVAKPDGLLLVPPDDELGFLHPLPVERLWGVGPKTAAKLHDRGITTVGEVARLAQPTLVSILGLASGRHLNALAHNRDPRPVQVGRRRGSIGSQCAIGWRPKSDDDIDATAVAIVDRVTRRMRAAGRVGRTVVLRMRFNDSTRATRSHTLPRATAQTETVLRAVRALLRSAGPLIDAQGLTLVGVSVANLDNEDAVQLTLPFDNHTDALDVALDEVHERFGSKAVTRATHLGRSTGIQVPLLPD